MSELSPEYGSCQEMTMRILIADSQTKVRYALSVLITERLKWVIAGTVVNGGDLLRFLSTCPLDILLLDYHLPGMRFDDLISEIRKIKKDLIIVCMSPNPDLRQKAEEFGVDYFVSKVDSPNKLLRVFRDCEDRIESSSSLNAT